jgi:cation diffusion facilitator CzcD-associated flavoprotein CzcO
MVTRLQRYDSATLHTTKRYSELPYLPYPKEWPTYLPKQNLADFYKRYVQAFGLPVYTNRACQTITWDPDQNCWDVTIVGPNGEEHVRVKSLVFATGIGGHAPYIPDLLQRVGVLTMNCSLRMTDLTCDADRNSSSGL